jgi:hypothetical protein
MFPRITKAKDYMPNNHSGSDRDVAQLPSSGHTLGNTDRHRWEAEMRLVKLDLKRCCMNRMQ